MGQVCEWSGVELWEGCVYEARLQGRKGGRIVRWHGRRGGNVMKWQFGKGGRVVSRESGMEFKDKIVLHLLQRREMQAEIHYREFIILI